MIFGNSSLLKVCCLPYQWLWYSRQTESISLSFYYIPFHLFFKLFLLCFIVSLFFFFNDFKEISKKSKSGSKTPLELYRETPQSQSLPSFLFISFLLSQDLLRLSVCPGSQIILNRFFKTGHDKKKKEF